MTASLRKGNPSLLQTLSTLLHLGLSDKLKFAIKTSFAMALAYLIPFSQGWAQAQTAAITIMLIAVAGPVSESVSKGLLRVVGTIIGAVIGMLLIGLFPQERALYLISLSLFVTITLYLTRAYKGDNTVFMLTAVTMMMVFKNGEIDDVFLYGIDRTFMTVFGIALYTLIAIFIWPVRNKDKTLDIAQRLFSFQAELYENRDAEAKRRSTLYQKLQSEEKALEEAVINTSTDHADLSKAQRATVLHNAREINELLLLLSYHDEAHYSKRYPEFVNNFSQADREIKTLFNSLQHALKEKKPIDIPDEWKAAYNTEAIQTLSHLDRAALTSTLLDIKALHEALRSFAYKINAVLSSYPTHFPLNEENAPSAFNWFDVEDLKGTLVSFLIFWSTVIFWIVVNPPAGFLIVTLATALSVLTTFSPLKPSLLIIIYSFSFIFATAMYILVLPHIDTGLELGIFIFIYSFIGFYFIPALISIFFLMGMAVLGLSNPMFYNFQIFLMVLFVFYLFLFVLMLFYYIPFSTKPERLFLTMKKRFFRLSADLMQRSNRLSENRGTLLGGIKADYAQKQLMPTVQKMQLWAEKIDTDYFHEIDKAHLTAFGKACETFAYLLQMMYRQESKAKGNPLIQALKESYQKLSLATLLEHYAQGANVTEVKEVWRDERKIMQIIEESLQHFLNDMPAGQYSEAEIIAFYENISLRRNVWVSMIRCQKEMESLDFRALEESRF